MKRRGDDQKFLAEVLAIGTECDIALLTIKDDQFWAGVAPLEFGALPKLQDAVAVVRVCLLHVLQEAERCVGKRLNRLAHVGSFW